MIPGMLDVRVRRPAARALDASPAAPFVPAADGDREQLERAREGGGASSERTGRTSNSILARLWRYMLRPTATPAI